jgi:hypothetical protein
MMTTTPLSKASREFVGRIAIGEFVAWWISEDGQASMPLVEGSYPTAAVCEAAASILLDDDSMADEDGRTLGETGYMEIERIIGDE